MQPGGADRYEALEIRIVKGHNPDLVVTSNGDERFDLTQYKTVDALHALLQQQGFAPRSNVELQNKDPQCFAWRDVGECVGAPTFMRENCALACRNLADKNALCAQWAANGECEKNKKFMHPECPVSCGWKEEL